MESDRHQRVKEIINEALQYSGSERMSAVANACGDDAEMYAEVKSLLQFDDSSGDPFGETALQDGRRQINAVLASGAGGSSAFTTTSLRGTSPLESGAPGPTRIGAYRIVRLLGQGGMGRVYLAEQEQPRRHVAVKVLRHALAGERVRERFAFEARVLGRLEHVGIARIYEAGTSDLLGQDDPPRVLAADQPFIAMELIQGEPLDRFARRTELAIPDRLRLFVQVCDAVTYAHTKGVIHRDLKPANILVTADGTPKVLDFGIARAAADSDEAMTTHAGQPIGTPAYMSPEQTEGTPDIDTRTDVYALGVSLYELLTGVTPFSADGQSSASLSDLQRMIRETDAPRPSTIISAARASQICAAGADAHTLRGLLKGEVDWIVLKALDKDRARRYQTAGELAADIKRFLTGDAVHAAPPSASYRMRKFVKRNRAKVVAGSLVAFALLAGFVGTSWGLLEANRAWSAERERADGEREARLDAQENEKIAVAATERERTARLDEERQRKFAEAISRFVQDDFLALTSIEGQERFGGDDQDTLGKDATLQQLLDRAARKLRARDDLDPLIEAELCWIIGVNYRAAGDARPAITFLTKAVDLRTSLLGRDHEETQSAMTSLAVAYLDDDRTEQAMALCEEASAHAMATQGPDDPTTLWCRFNLADAYRRTGKLDEAVAIHEDTLRRRTAILGTDDRATLYSMNNLAETYRDLDRLEEAIDLHETLVKRAKDALGADHYITLSSITNLAASYSKATRYELALSLQEETLARQKASLGNDHPVTLVNKHNIAVTHWKRGRLDLALPMLEDTYKLMKDKRGLEHPETLSLANDLAAVYKDSGKLKLALPLFVETLKLRRRRLGRGHADTIMTTNNLAAAYRDAGKHELAMPLWKDALKQARTTFGNSHPDTLHCMNNLATAYVTADELSLAVPLLEEVLTLRQATLGAEDADTRLTMNNLATAYRHTGMADKALQLFEETYRITHGQLGSDAAETLSAMSNLAASYWTARQLDKSIPMFEEILKRRETTLGRDHVDTLATIANLGVNYKDAGRLTEAAALLEEAHRATRTHSNLNWVVTPLLEVYRRTNDHARLVSLLDQQLSEARESLPSDSPTLAALLAQSGITLLEFKKWEESEPYLRECLEIRRKSQPNDWTTFNAASMLGGALVGQNRLEEAEPLLREGYQEMKQRESEIPPEARFRLCEALDRLVKLSEAANRPDNVATWQAERAACMHTAPATRPN